jgi:hypothetical protein
MGGKFIRYPRLYSFNVGQVGYMQGRMSSPVALGSVVRGLSKRVMQNSRSHLQI